MMNRLLLLAIPLLFLTACSNEKYQVLEGYAQGTTFKITYKSSKNYEIEIYELIKEFDLTLSIHEKQSILSKINRNEPNVELTKIFHDFFDKSYEVYLKSDGYFDVTVGPLVNAWGFGVDNKITADSSKIDSIKAIVGMDKVKIVNNRLVKEDPRIFIDANAIIKGLSIDFLCEFLEKEGVENYKVEIGGEARVKGVNEKGQVWEIGIDKPTEGPIDMTREIQTNINLNNKALSTAGNFKKFLEWKGIKYSHSINPKTGYPSRDIILSACVVADECSIADAYSTACMVMGFEKAKAMLAKNKNIDAYLIFAGNNAEFEIYYTEGFEKYLDKE